MEVSECVLVVEAIGLANSCCDSVGTSKGAQRHLVCTQAPLMMVFTRCAIIGIVAVHRAHNGELAP